MDGRSEVAQKTPFLIPEGQCWVAKNAFMYPRRDACAKENKSSFEGGPQKQLSDVDEQQDTRT